MHNKYRNNEAVKSAETTLWNVGQKSVYRNRARMEDRYVDS